MTDPIADMLTRVRNALAVRKPDVVVPHSRLKAAVARILEQEGWVGAVAVVEQTPSSMLKITLKYGPDGSPWIRHLKRVSTPGRRRYVGKTEIPLVLNNMGIAILSTSHGVMTSRRARTMGVGGEVLCEIA